MSEKIKSEKSARITSLDITRGAIVFLSIFAFSIPNGFSHAPWYGLTMLDVIFPAFVTIFGTSMAIAYHKGVSVEKMTKRTIRLILYGLLFNIVAAWSFDFSTLRFTGVLQLFAVIGVVTVILTKYIKRLSIILVIALAVFTLHGIALLYVGNQCADGLPQVDCNPSAIIDPMVFGDNHIYAQGERGHDPEGIPSMFAALGNALLGFIAGKMLLQKLKNVSLRLIIYSFILFLLAFFTEQFIPFGKRLWTPSFGLITASITIFSLAIFYMLFDKSKSKNPSDIKKTTHWILEAYGRNSFLVYFGKYVLYAFMIHLKVPFLQKDVSLYTFLMDFFSRFGLSEQLSYFVFYFGLWLFITLYAHKRRLYLKV